MPLPLGACLEICSPSKVNASPTPLAVVAPTAAPAMFPTIGRGTVSPANEAETEFKPNCLAVACASAAGIPVANSNALALRSKP